MLNTTTIKHKWMTIIKAGGLFTLCVWLLLLSAGSALAQSKFTEDSVEQDPVKVATVVLDGHELFLVRGVESYPAGRRAHDIRERIKSVARDSSIDVANLVVEELDDRSVVKVGDIRIVSIFEEDAALEGVHRPLLAQIIRTEISQAVEGYRYDRSSPVLLTNIGLSLALTLLVILLIWGTQRLFRWAHKWAVSHVRKGINDLATKSHHLIPAAQLWTVFAALLNSLRFFVIIMLVYSYLNTVLGLFPWTRPAALVLFELVLNPLESLWLGFIASLPNIAFLGVLFLVIRYVLKLTSTFFKQIETGRIVFDNFDNDWAIPTYKIIRILILAFSLVLAYPYIPGSDSLAFKGVSVFLGVIFSLGSSSFISNMIAGVAMTYRGAFKEGDRVKIDDVVGQVTDIKLMVTRIRTPKNESIVVPNSNILNANVVNYTSLAKKDGLVLHTTVGIGYDVPWRQVEAMLLMAADRTAGVEKEPAPFVLQTSLGDFTALYEINAYCKDESKMLQRYSVLHSHIQDVFNEYGVQIMSPNYEADPEVAKVVHPDNFFTAPAKKPES
jgi:small-conductance mechanosensitive channel